jgi:hypothetical protein
MLRDPQFGPLMMFGWGGVEVEGLKDVAFALAPLNQAEAEKLTRKTWAGRKLKGFLDIPLLMRSLLSMCCSKSRGSPGKTNPSKRSRSIRCVF